jgi:hypothetical protein
MNSITTGDITPGQNRALDLALQHALRPPPLPDEFRSQLLSAVRQETVRDVKSRKRALDLEYVKSLQRLHGGHVRLQRDTLALILVVAFTAGACANLALPWLQNLLDIDMAVTAPLLALAIGLGAGASVWLDRFARPGWLFDADTE